jgi:hypothetical protein
MGYECLPAAASAAESAASAPAAVRVRCVVGIEFREEELDTHIPYTYIHREGF